MTWLLFRRILFLAIGAASFSSISAQAKPNVVLIICDDLNDYITGMGGHPQATTPNIERLAQSGVAFRRAYSNNPICAPSRSSFLTGIYPHKSGNLFFDKWFENPVLKNSKTVMEYFRENGYYVTGTGKIMHHHLPAVWSEYGHKADYGPFVFDGQARVAHPSVPEPFRSIGPVDGSFAALDDIPYADDADAQTGWIYGTWGKNVPFRYRSEHDRDPTPDERNAAWAANRIRAFAEQEDGQPFFLAVGFIRPHTPLHVPRKYFDMFALDSLGLPLIKPNDVEDTHFSKYLGPDQKGIKYFQLLQQSYPSLEEGLKTFTRAYLACVAAVDDCIGQVIDAVDHSPFRDQTIVIVTSDHGWQMGQKDYLFKNSPWEESTRVPLIIRAPGITQAGKVADHPVSLIDLYPTLIDLCGLEGDTQKSELGAPLDGHSLRPFLENPESSDWEGSDAALSMIFVGNSPQKLSPAERQRPENQHWTIRTKRWRYIRYNDGAEELYDHDQDAREWVNLADAPEHAATKAALQQQLQEMLSEK